MATLTGRLRRRLLAPAAEGVRFAARGFPATEGPAVRLLEQVPAAVVRGFRGTIDGSPLTAVPDRAAAEPAALRGFHHEGAVMAACVMDAMAPRSGSRARILLTGPTRHHVLLGWIGVGFALAKLPRPLWRRAIPALDDVAHQGVLDALAIDGWAFDLSFFDPRRHVTRHEAPPRVAWRGETVGVDRIADQGVGRALWFVHGAEVDQVAAAVAGFAPTRRRDLWAGVGLAATLAGGAAPGDLRRLRELGDPDELALGAALAARAADEAVADTGTVPGHTTAGTAVLCGLGVAEASRLVIDHAPHRRAAGPAEYLRWRARVRSQLAGGASPPLRAA